jgi:GH18 family chitinase
MSNALVNAWLFLNEDEPSGSNYDTKGSCYQTLISNNVYQAVDILYLCFVTTVPASNNPFYTVRIGSAAHPGGLTNQDYMNYVLRDARQKNPQIKIAVTLDWGQPDILSNIFSNKKQSDQQNAQGFAANLAAYLLTCGLDGFDVDWERPVSTAITTSQFQLLFDSIRAAFDKLEQQTGKHYYLTLSPAEVGNLDAAAVNRSVDFVNLQLYSGFTSADEFTRAGVDRKLLSYGAKFESNYENAQTAYAGYSKGGYSVITQWRLNSDNFDFEQKQQQQLYQLIKPSSAGR